MTESPNKDTINSAFSLLIGQLNDYYKVANGVLSPEQKSRIWDAIFLVEKGMKQFSGLDTGSED